MASFSLPLTNDLSQVFRTTIGGKSVSIQMRWNELDQFWYMDMDVDGVRVLTGRRMVLSSNLAYTQVALPGYITVRALVANNSDEPGRFAWGVTHDLVYVEA